MLSVFGKISLFTSEANSTLSVSASPIVILPPSVKFPVTAKLPVMFVSAWISTVFVALSITKFCVSVSIVFPLNLKSPVSIFVPSINVTLPPEPKVIPCGVLIFKFTASKTTSPVSWLTKKLSPTLKSPFWSTLVNLTFALFNSSTSFACITVVSSLVTSLPFSSTLNSSLFLS